MVDKRADVSKQPRGEAAYELILQKILNGELTPGQAIVESRLAESLGVSRTPIREAMYRLVQEGFAISSTGSGFSVSPLTEREAREAYPLIAGLEVVAIEESGPLLATVVDKLVEINEALAKSRDIAAAIQLDSRWHDELISSCGNQRLLNWVSTLRRTVYRYEIMYMADLPLIGQSVKQHAHLIELIHAGNVEALASELKRHYRFGMEAVVLKLASHDASSRSGSLH